MIEVFGLRALMAARSLVAGALIGYSLALLHIAPQHSINRLIAGFVYYLASNFLRE
jgi:hypothetical protein